MNHSGPKGIGATAAPAVGGIIGTSLSLTGTVAGVGSAYLLWRSLNEAPTFEYPIVRETFTEQPCGEEAVYTAPGKDANNKDEDLTYSIIASEFDDSDLVQIDNDGKVTFKQDPLFDSPGDRDRDGIYSFTVQVEDPRGETAEQAVFLTIERKAAVDFVAVGDTLDFIQHGGSVCADHFEIDASSMSPSLFDISGGSGNDLADIHAADVTDIGIRLGAGGDTLFVDNAATGVQDVLIDLGDGRDTIELDAHVQTMVVQNFDADDLLILDGGRLTDGSALALRSMRPHRSSSPVNCWHWAR